MSDKRQAELLANFMEDAVIKHKSSFVAVARIPEEATSFDKVKHVLLPRDRSVDNEEAYHNPYSAIRRRYDKRHTEDESVGDLTIDLKGETVAHVMSVTKAIIGLLWGYCIHNCDGRFPELKKQLLDKASEQSKLGFYLMTDHVNISVIRNALVTAALTQTTGIVIADTNAFSMLRTLIMSSRHEAGSAAITSIDTELSENLFATPVQKNEFHYSDKMTQVASMALEDMFKKLLGFNFLLADYIPKVFFPAAVRDAQNIREWPIISAGYAKTFTTCTSSSASAKLLTVTKTVYNTLGFWGIRMTGQQMLELGAHLLLKHRDLLLKIYDDKDLYVTLPPLNHPETIEDTAKLGGDVHATRAAWRYSCYWWIPRYEDYPEINNKYKWISAIGHEGQFILLELTQRWVFIRQHFTDSPAFQNVDMQHVTSSASDLIRYPAFCYDAFILVNELSNPK